MKMNSNVENMFKNVVKSVSDVHPDLQCLHIENGNGTVTDSHRMVVVRNMAPRELKTDINLSEFSFPEIRYPDVGKLIPKNFLTTFELLKLDIKNLLPALKAMTHGYNPVVDIRATKDEVTVTRSTFSIDGTQSVSLIPHDFTGEEMKISCDARYLTEALGALSQFEDTRIQKVELKLNTALTPFLLSIKNIDYLITPIRKF